MEEKKIVCQKRTITQKCPCCGYTYEIVKHLKVEVLPAKKLLNVPDPRHYPLRREEILSDEVTKGDEPFIDDFRSFSYETRSSARCNYKLVSCPKCGVILFADKATKEDLADE